MPVDNGQLERAFWLDVILFAQKEAQSGNKTQRRLAIRWLTTCSRSLMQVCEMAGLNSVQISTLLNQEQKKYGVSRRRQVDFGE